jgi:hypothetical protein
MRLSTLAISLSAIGVLAACSHKETVVERPVVEKQTVIERPVPSPAVGATVAPRACAYGNAAYSDGALSCQNGQAFRCSDGAWNRTLGSC